MGAGFNETTPSLDILHKITIKFLASALSTNRTYFHVTDITLFIYFSILLIDPRKHKDFYALFVYGVGNRVFYSILQSKCVFNMRVLTESQMKN